MKKLTSLVALAMLVSMLAIFPASAEEVTYTQAPMFDGMDLPRSRNACPRIPMSYT